jgi:hypothetical protein
LRDDFLSLFVRGCWLVSFFFTPIYMFVLVFLVMFGPKKGSIIAYSPNWDFKNAIQLSGLLQTGAGKISSLLKYRFHFTTVTSRFTSYVLFSFWIFFFFYGETLLLVVLNYSTPVDTISSSSFFTIKQHIIFFLTTTSAKLSGHINFYIFYLTSCAFMFLSNFNFYYNYNSLRLNYVNSFLLNTLVILVVVSSCLGL